MMPKTMTFLPAISRSSVALLIPLLVVVWVDHVECQFEDTIVSKQMEADGSSNNGTSTSGIAILDPQLPNPCPVGFMCSRDVGRETACEALKQFPIQAGLGNVHDGVYCPGSFDRTQDNGYKLCDPGYYCPNAVRAYYSVISLLHERQTDCCNP